MITVYRTFWEKLLHMAEPQRIPKCHDRLWIYKYTELFIEIKKKKKVYIHIMYTTIQHNSFLLESLPIYGLTLSDNLRTEEAYHLSTFSLIHKCAGCSIQFFHLVAPLCYSDLTLLQKRCLRWSMAILNKKNGCSVGLILPGEKTHNDQFLI